MALHPEQAEQVFLFEWIRTIPEIAGVAFHIPNGWHRNIYYAALLKRMGVLSGVSDIFIPIPKKGFHGLFIELKAKNKSGRWGRASIEQHSFLKSITSLGYKGEICLGCEAAKDLIISYLED